VQVQISASKNTGFGICIIIIYFLQDLDSTDTGSELEGLIKGWTPRLLWQIVCFLSLNTKGHFMSSHPFSSFKITGEADEQFIRNNFLFMFPIVRHWSVENRCKIK